MKFAVMGASRQNPRLVLPRGSIFAALALPRFQAASPRPRLCLAVSASALPRAQRLNI